jgi:DNA-binding NarL/FixJ family response regulator
MSLKILIVEDQALIRRGLVGILMRTHPTWQIHEAENGIQALLKAATVKADIILMDYLMPKLDGISATIAIRKEMPNARIIMVSQDLSEDFIVRALNAGVVGMVPKDASEHEFLKAIHDVREGKKHFHQKIKAVLESASAAEEKKREPKDDPSSEFSGREIEVLRLLVQGMTSAGISEKLDISTRTVETHRAKILKKCDLKTTASLIRYVVKNKLIEL